MNRTSSQKPGDELLANFRQQFPEVAAATSSSTADPASTVTAEHTDASGIAQERYVQQNRTPPQTAFVDFPRSKGFWMPRTGDARSFLPAPRRRDDVESGRRGIYVPFANGSNGGHLLHQTRTQIYSLFLRASKFAEPTANPMRAFETRIPLHGRRMTHGGSRRLSWIPALFLSQTLRTPLRATIRQRLEEPTRSIIPKPATCTRQVWRLA